MADDQIQAGWYPDPSGDLAYIRYWDGSDWTELTYPVSYYNYWAAGMPQPQYLSQPTNPYQPQSQLPYQPQSQLPYQSQAQYPYQVPYYYQNPIPYQMSAGYPLPAYQSSVGTSTTRDNLAVAGMICGIAGIVSCVLYIGVLPGLLGIIFGILGLKSNKKSMAIAGIACGSAALVLFVLYITVMVAGNTLTNVNPYDPGSIQNIFGGQAF